MTTILSIALPFFAVILAGLAAGRWSVIPASDSEALNRFVFRVAMPVALFGLTARADPLTLSDAHYAGLYLIAALTTLGLTYGTARRFFALPRPDAGVHGFAATLGNAVFLGLPIAQMVENWARPFIVLMLMEGLVILTVASILIAARVDDDQPGLRTPLREIVVRPFKNPLVIGSVSGFLIGLTPIALPVPVDRFLSLLGQAAGPVALFSLGLFLSANTLHRKAALSPATLHIVFCKLVFLPGLFFLLLNLAGLAQSSIIGPCLLFVLVPTGITVYIQASARARYHHEAATAITITTLLSALTISGILFLYG